MFNIHTVYTTAMTVSEKNVGANALLGMCKSFSVGFKNQLMSVKIVFFTFIFVVVCLTGDHGQCEAKVFERCELARLLRQRYGVSLDEAANWVCIAQHSSGLNSAAYASGLAGGSHGLFQISDVFWCSPPGKGFGCNTPCERLRDNDLADDFACVRIIFAEHQRISGNGYTAWNAYGQNCRQNTHSYIEGCFANERPSPFRSYQPQPSTELAIYSNSVSDYTLKKAGKVYNRCELAQELYYKHKIPTEQIATWVCIAQHESNFDTTAVGRLNADGSADHGLFQISDLFWCSHDRYSGGKACGLSCSKLLDSDITDDVRCIRRIHDEHTRLSGDGFTAWTVYNHYCRNQEYERVSKCFNHQTQLPKSFATIKGVPQVPFLHAYSHNTQHHQYSHQHSHKQPAQTTPAHQNYQSNPFLRHVLPSSGHQAKPHHHQNKHTISSQHHHTQTPASGSAFHYHDPYKSHKGKVYKRCELVQELYFKHKFPIQDIATWVCIAEHESRFDTSAVGRLNGDGSTDHGLFQISDLYWCTHDTFGGKGCGIQCHKLLDTDITDDIKCIRTIYDEHTRISGDGFTAWTVYNRNCRGQHYSITDCFHKENSTDFLNGGSPIISSKNNGAKGDNINRGQGKIYNECELAEELYTKHKFPLDQIATWVCIAQHESHFDTSAVGHLNADGSADHGIFQISDLYWCSHDINGGKACNIPCRQLLDSDIADDVKCIKQIYNEHTRISGNGFTAWTVYNRNCRNQDFKRVSKCFANSTIETIQTPITSTSSISKRKRYQKCELAQELYFKHKIPMSQVPTWVCIAQHESNYDTSAVGRLNTDGSADYGLFQISDLYWCSHTQNGGKACHISCDKLLDNDIRDDVNCIKKIYDEHSRISGNGFTAWTVYNPHCRSQEVKSVADCFEANQLENIEKTTTSSSIYHRRPTIKLVTENRKIYNKCELAQELYFTHEMPMEQVPTWVCIAKHESSFDTSAIGRLNADGSADHGLFQISDSFWCSHDPHGGKACNIPCNKLLDGDITDDVRCIKKIYDEHTRISGDGFTAWTVYKRNCLNQELTQIKNCFDLSTLENMKQHSSNLSKVVSIKSSQLNQQTNYNHHNDYFLKNTNPKGKLNHPFVGNPFLNKLNATAQISLKTTLQASTSSPQLSFSTTSLSSDIIQHPNYIRNPFLKKYVSHGSKQKPANKENIPLTKNAIIVPKNYAYALNPFLTKPNSALSVHARKHNDQLQQQNKNFDTALETTNLESAYQKNPFLQNLYQKTKNQSLPIDPPKRNINGVPTPIASKKQGTYVNSDSFRIVTTTNTYTTPKTAKKETRKYIAPAEISTSTTSYPKTTSKQQLQTPTVSTKLVTTTKSTINRTRIVQKQSTINQKLNTSPTYSSISKQPTSKTTAMQKTHRAEEIRKFNSSSRISTTNVQKSKKGETTKPPTTRKQSNSLEMSKLVTASSKQTPLLKKNDMMTTKLSLTPTAIRKISKLTATSTTTRKPTKTAKKQSTMRTTLKPGTYIASRYNSSSWASIPVANQRNTPSYKQIAWTAPAPPIHSSTTTKSTSKASSKNSHKQTSWTTSKSTFLSRQFSKTPTPKPTTTLKPSSLAALKQTTTSSPTTKPSITKSTTATTLSNTNKLISTKSPVKTLRHPSWTTQIPRTTSPPASQSTIEKFTNWTTSRPKTTLFIASNQTTMKIKTSTALRPTNTSKTTPRYTTTWPTSKPAKSTNKTQHKSTISLKNNQKIVMSHDWQKDPKTTTLLAQKSHVSTRKTIATPTITPSKYLPNNNLDQTTITTYNKTYLQTTQYPKISSQEYNEKYRKDPFSHPFFSKYNEQFQNLFGNKHSPTPSTTKAP